MSHPLLVLVLGALAVIAAGVPAWAHLSPASFWLGLGFPAKALRVRLTWTHVAASCGLASQRRRWRWTLDAVPVAGTLKRTSVLLTPGRRMRRVTVPHAPGLGLLRLNRMGWRVRVRLVEGQVPADYQRAAEQLAHAWRVHAVRVTASSPGRVWLLATRTDPLIDVGITPATGQLLAVQVGMLETRQPSSPATSPSAPPKPPNAPAPSTAASPPPTASPHRPSPATPAASSPNASTSASSPNSTSCIRSRRRLRRRWHARGGQIRGSYASAVTGAAQCHLPLLRLSSSRPPRLDRSLRSRRRRSALPNVDPRPLTRDGRLRGRSGRCGPGRRGRTRPRTPGRKRHWCHARPPGTREENPG
jgi:hypothetical protein